MSTSPPEPENAAPVRPEQAREPAQIDDHNNARRAAARRNPSSSLLSRLFSPSYRVDESNTVAAGSGDFRKTVADTDSPCQEGIEGNNLDEINNPDTRHPMATTMPPTKLPARSVGATPTNVSHEFDLSDLREANSFLAGHRDLLNSRRTRGTSLERTQKEKRVQDFSKSVFSINPGDTGTINSPAPQSPSTSITSSDNPVLDGVRANYRSWRDTHPGMAAEKAWSIGEQASGEVPEGLVEKSIAEALAGIEPNNRQRKSSHSLRFFKEGLPDEKPKRREPKDIGRPKDMLPRMKDLVPLDIRDGDENHDGKSLNRSSDGVTLSNIGTSAKTLDGHDRTGESDRPLENPQPQFDQRFDALPGQLLDDFTKEHNLAPAPAKGSSFSRPLPVSDSEREKPSSKPQEVHDAEVPEADNVENKSVTKDDDEESGEEQISSALFVPHKTSHDPPGRELLDPGEQDQSGSPTERSDPADSEGWLVEHTVPARDDDEIQLEKAATRDLIGARSSYTPEKEYDNYFSDPLQSPDLPSDAVSETGYSTKDEDSSLTDDAETTPTGKTNGIHFMSQNHKDHLHHHQQVAKAPLEAIELIPYRHQVGGHTTMWRFSRRAVCKQLNNRENEFYERIERYHPKLLKFMPRYVCFA
jgi:inositol-hexakisphosphate 5-kinase